MTCQRHVTGASKPTSARQRATTHWRQCGTLMYVSHRLAPTQNNGGQAPSPSSPPPPSKDDGRRSPTPSNDDGRPTASPSTNNRQRAPTPSKDDRHPPAPASTMMNCVCSTNVNPDFRSFLRLLPQTKVRRGIEDGGRELRHTST
ncbi:hypothetical protein K443DRAFT_16076 [Laccaria amethystina LaAM-08-1]|uniref:Uncharacterized protein n=1 Tax=Laccaria amethystina LaAM-08-1 TaxID=1095629 RepID=A0A0C9WPK5_9AGAR|nr:hypothetical protein K443DRAFT_16076 [Laccaria amethystina LaAM-08-1]